MKCWPILATTSLSEVLNSETSAYFLPQKEINSANFNFDNTTSGYTNLLEVV